MRFVAAILCLLSLAIAFADTARAAGIGDATELAYWNSVKGSQNPVIVQTYLTRYPNGIFAEVARVMVAALGPAETAALDEARARESRDRDLPRLIQEALDSVGCDPGPIDGIWGRRSQRALDDFAAAAIVSPPQQVIGEATLDLVEAFDGRVCQVLCSAREAEGDVPCVTRQPQRQAIEPPVEGSFDDPAIGGLPLDICVSAGASCRGQAALRYCRDQGYRSLVEHTTAIFPETAHIAGGTCTPRDPILCGGYARIVCAR
jgi:hypothetical protein